MTATISPSTVAAGGQATLSVTTGTAPPLGSWTLYVTGASGSLNHTAQLYAVVDGPEPSTIIGPVPGAILNSGSNLFTWNLGAGVSQYALQVGSVPGGYDYANITGNAQTLRQAAGVLGAQVYLPSTLGHTIYATLTSTIGVVQQSQSYTYTIGNRSQYARPTGPTIVTPAPTLYTDYQPVDFTYTFQSGSPQLLNPIVQTGDPTLYGQIISVTPTTATVRFRATAVAPGTSQGSLALSAQISRAGQTSRYRRSPGAQLQSGGGGRFMSCGFDGDEACPVCDPVAVELYGTCGSCDPATQLWCIPAPMPAPPTEVISSPAIPTITQVDRYPQTVVAGAAEQITLYSSNFANWGFTACPVNSSTLQLTGDGCVDPDKTSTGSGTMTISWTTIPRILGGMTLCIMPKSNFGAGTVMGVCLATLAFLVSEDPTPPTTITYKGSVIASSDPGITCASPTCSIVVGQQITLTGYPTGGLWTIGGITHQSWAGDGTAPKPVDISSNTIQLYWVTGGNYTVTYTVSGLSALVSFSIAAPTLSAYDPMKADPQVVGGLVGANLTVTATVLPPPLYPGSISWASVMSNDVITFSGAPAGIVNQRCSAPGTSPWIDLSYPYPATSSGSSSTFTDSPQTDLAQIQGFGYTRTTTQDAFTTYLLWQPSVSPSSPVPLKLIVWRVNWNATLAGGWSVTGSLDALAITQTSDYPLWSSTAPYGHKVCQDY